MRRWWRYQRLLAIRYHADLAGETRRAEWATWALERLEANR